MRDRPPHRRRAAAFVVLAAVLAATAVPSPSSASSARTERERVRRERARAAADLDVLRAKDEDVERALDATNRQVVAEQQALANAEAAVRAAEVALVAASAAEAAMTARVRQLRDALRDMAIQEYITGGRLRLARLSSSTHDLTEWARRNALADLALGSASATRDGLRAAQEDLGVARANAARASKDAASRRNEVAARVGEVRAARDQQAAFARHLDERIESRLSEAAVLAGRDAALSAEIARQQAALAARNAGGGGSGARSARGNIPLRTVRGITVAADIADRLDAMLAAAAADGIVLGGWGYRNPQDQERLRELHCPDPERSASTSCRPPTARPGYSMHERGLAVDFTYDGSTVRAGSSAYRWLQRNAAAYGLHNLPGEPWHWSTNGN